MPNYTAILGKGMGMCGWRHKTEVGGQRSEDSIATPCSVKAVTRFEYLMFEDVTDCDILRPIRPIRPIRQAQGRQAPRDYARDRQGRQAQSRQAQVGERSSKKILEKFFQQLLHAEFFSPV